MIVILLTRQAAAEAEYEVSIFGGYEDENNTSEDITESLLMSMQVSQHDMLAADAYYVLQAHEARFRVVVAATGWVNTVTKAGVAWPRVYGAAVR